MRIHLRMVAKCIDILVPSNQAMLQEDKWWVEICWGMSDDATDRGWSPCGHGGDAKSMTSIAGQHVDLSMDSYTSCRVIT